MRLRDYVKKDTQITDTQLNEGKFCPSAFLLQDSCKNGRGDCIKCWDKSYGNLVHHPAHYCYSEYEPKDVIRAWSLNFNLGSAVKYIARAGRKDDILQELNKAKQFIEFEIEAIEKERAKT